MYKKQTLLLFAFFALLSGGSFSQNADIDLLRQINHNRSQQWDPTMHFVSETTPYISAGIPALIAGYGFFKKDSITFVKGFQMGGALFITTAVTLGLKYGINRQRPYETYPDVDNQLLENSPSFTSGHTGLAFSTATSLSISYPRWYVALPAYAWASTVAYSRMHLGVHYPSDVLGGMITGAGSAFLSHYLTKKWLHSGANRKTNVSRVY